VLRGGSSPPLGFVISRSRVQVPPPAPAPTAEPAAQTGRPVVEPHAAVLVDSDAILIEPARIQYWTFRVRPEMRNAHLVGTFEALGGTGNDVRVMGVTPKQFLEWRNGQLHCKGSVARCMLRSTSAVGCKIHRWRTLDRWTFRYRSPARIMLSLTTPFLSSLPRTSPRRSALPTTRRVFDSLGRRPTTKRGAMEHEKPRRSRSDAAHISMSRSRSERGSRLLPESDLHRPPPSPHAGPTLR